MLQKFINNIQLTLNLKQWYLKITILNYRRYCTAEQDDVEMANGGETQIHSSLQLDNGEIAAEDDTANANDLPEYSDNFEMNLNIIFCLIVPQLLKMVRLSIYIFGIVIKCTFILTYIMQTYRYCIRCRSRTH